jgi:hypothetical protein
MGKKLKHSNGFIGGIIGFVKIVFLGVFVGFLAKVSVFIIWLIKKNAYNFCLNKKLYVLINSLVFHYFAYMGPRKLP